MMSAKRSAKTHALFADLGATKLMWCLCLPSKKKEEILLRTDDRRPTRIPNNIGQKLSQNPRAVCRLGSDKADAISLPSLQKERRNPTQN
jgi:hypothetical protein